MNVTHPNPIRNRLIQQGAALLCVVMLAAAGLQVVLALAITPGGLFLLTALFTLALMPFVLMLTAATPAVTITPEGLHIQPVIWRARFISWDSIRAVKPYPLLPQRESETTRRALVGKNTYRPAEGIMLVIPALPVQYRIAGFLAGEGGQPVIAITNRTHMPYDEAAAQIKAYKGLP